MRISDWSSDVCSSDLDAAAAPVPALVVSDRFVAGFPTWDAGLDALGFQRIPEPVGVIAAVAEQPLRLWEIVQQRGCTGVVADLPGGHEEADRKSTRLNSKSLMRISYAVFCLKKKKQDITKRTKQQK